jgi:hypothetical protein
MSTVKCRKLRDGEAQMQPSVIGGALHAQRVGEAAVRPVATLGR